MTDLPTFDLHLVGKVLHEPADFHPDSPIGGAFAEMLRASQALGDADQALAAAKRELRELEGFIQTATMKTSDRAFGQAFSRAELIRHSIPNMELKLQQAHAANTVASTRFNSTGGYAGYEGAVYTWNLFCTQGLDYYENPGQLARHYLDEIKRLPAILNGYEAQLKENYTDE